MLFKSQSFRASAILRVSTPLSIRIRLVNVMPTLLLRPFYDFCESGGGVLI